MPAALDEDEVADAGEACAKGAAVKALVRGLGVVLEIIRRVFDVVGACGVGNVLEELDGVAAGMRSVLGCWTCGQLRHALVEAVSGGEIRRLGVCICPCKEGVRGGSHWRTRGLFASRAPARCVWRRGYVWRSPGTRRRARR
ncbi:hypothetical protein EKH77_29150 [Streptomyces luteoverticillatus]|uniref:Uncharacterized protein n=1 Tax=Streptomyces luteoverticillatus TaxID=66425 RepID=A0A3S9PQN8_STRLT|nr:hypothetical protein [Streptomyces luteoverticillatus]AZQ74732.1 hypothetical protein EKH77_29150 [Streptomyces luteoverticillatus]